MASSMIKSEFVILMHQFLGEENFKKTLHMLEQESGIYFDVKYFEEKVLDGELDEVEKYVSGFTDIHDNQESLTIYFEIRKQKYLEALDRQDKVKALEILMNDLKVFSQFNEDLYKEMTQLLTLKNIRESEQLLHYTDTKTARRIMLTKLNMLIKDNPRFEGKLSLPTTLFNQSLNLQHQLPYNAFLMPDGENAAPNKVAGLLYTNKEGFGLLALGSNGNLKLWKNIPSEENPIGKVGLLKHKNLMRNNLLEVSLQKSVFALSKNDSYIMVAIGGEVSLLNMVTFEVMTTFLPPPPAAATVLAFYPQDNNIIAIGMEDSTIFIYNVKENEVISELRGHQKRVTGLAFSTRLNILISCGADAQLCEWNLDSWMNTKSVFLPLPAEKESGCDTRVQFNSDSVRILVSNEKMLAIYDSFKKALLWQWVPQGVLYAHISSAAYSYNSVLVYASFYNGYVGVFDGDTLTLRCHIPPNAYLSMSGLNESVYPLVIATHPRDEDQFAIGLSHGSVVVFTQARGGVASSNNTGSSASTSNHVLDAV